MSDYSSIKILRKTKNSADKLATKFEMNQLEFYESMVQYFQKTGVNPRDMQILSPAEELKKFRDTIISFLRKQEKDFILPTFGQMSTLIARFMEYINEEAPRRGDAPKQKELLKVELPNVGREGVFEGERKEEEESNVNESLAVKPNADYLKLKNDYERLLLTFNTTKTYFSNVIENTSFGLTGLTKKPIIELPMADINDYKEYIKRLEAEERK